MDQPESIDQLLERARSFIDRLTPSEALTAQGAGALVVDIRPDAQRRRDGALAGALVIDRNVLEWRLAPTSNWRIPEISDASRRVVLICNQGFQSSLAACTLRQLGLPNAADVIGGFEAWLAAGLPIVNQLEADGPGSKTVRQGGGPRGRRSSSADGEAKLGLSTDELTAEEQTAILAERYSQAAEAYDTSWSPVIRPIGERLLAHLPLAAAKDVIDVATGAGALLPSIQKAAPMATILGVDNSEGMLRLAGKRHAGPLKLMDAQELALPDNQFDVAIVAFVLFHLPSPERCLSEVNRVLKGGGAIGTVTWGKRNDPLATEIWDEELEAAGARLLELPATDSYSRCDSPEKVAALLEQAGFLLTRVWTESLEHQWRPDEHFLDQELRASLLRLRSLSGLDREACLQRVRERLAGRGADQYLDRSDVVMATAVKQGR
jgi:ubiquinone/menaquinone biosynthesis C-methylase UbiE/rhodanese-related sulfurtransferase